MPNNDILWKGIIEDLLEDFLRFFFPEVEFDLRKGYSFLDKELQEMYLAQGEKHETRRVDKLIKLFTRTGKERWVLIHIEVQGYKDRNFPKRVFQYYYRITDAYKKPVSTLVIFTDSDRSYKPSEYHSRQFGTELRFTFPVYKVAEQDAGELQKSDNPFSLVVLTVLKAITRRKSDPAVLKDIRISLVRNLLSHQISKKKIKSILTFIRFYGPALDAHWNFQFEKEVEILTSKNKTAMGVVEIVQQQLIEKARKEEREIGIEQGMEKGIEQGVKKGIEQGVKKGREERNFLATKNMLLKKFAVADICDILEVSPEYVQKVKEQLDDSAISSK